ncbi:trypsin-like serine peptidase [Qipengyuania gelatinilytica]
MSFAPVGELSCSKGLSTQVLQGTVVGRRDTLLTVAHVLDGNTPERGTWLKGCIFRLFDRDGRIRFASRVSVASRPSESLRWSYALDWAILRLEKNALVEPAQVADLHSALESGHHSLAYFSRNRGRRFLQIASRCSVRTIRPRSIVLKHDCPSWKGTSGSPLLARTRDGYRVFGIQAKVGGYAVGIAGWPLEELRKATAVGKGDTDGALFPTKI